MGAFLRVPENELLTQRVSKSGMTVLYRNPDFSAYDTADAMGLTSESIEQSGGQSPEKYGVMLISLDPDILQQQAAEKIGSTLRYMSEEDTMLRNRGNESWHVVYLRSRRRLFSLRRECS